MMKPGKKITRNKFLKMLGYIGLSLGAGPALFAASFKKKSETEGTGMTDGQRKDNPKVPRRILGKTNVKIPVLSHGVMYNLVENQIVIYNGLKWGIDMIDTSHSYAGGNSELGIGKFLARNPDKRKDFFIVSKASRANTSTEVEEKLQTSFKRINTNYIDLYYGVHGLTDPADLTDDLRKWAESAKKRKLIKYFGFSTHHNMAKCLKAAAKLGWIDAVMTSYNFRLMQNPEMQEAVEACHKANVGLIAMKVMGHRSRQDDDAKIIKSFTDRGYTEEQAKLKYVLEDKRIASACVTMNSVDQIISNATAAIDRKKLTRADANRLRQYADATCSSYCTGCSEICDKALPEAAPYISDVMRHLMYYNGYGDKDMARGLFAEIPATVRRKLLAFDYTKAERVCPQGMPIGAMMAEAVRILS
jgi:hypothetical protein